MQSQQYFRFDGSLWEIYQDGSFWYVYRIYRDHTADRFAKCHSYAAAVQALKEIVGM